MTVNDIPVRAGAAIWAQRLPDHSVISLLRDLARTTTNPIERAICETAADRIAGKQEP